MIARLLDRLRRRPAPEIGRLPTVSVPHLVLGTEYGAHCVATEPLTRSVSPLVYSFGLGQDISFDLELITRFGARVIGFDPTPRSIAWVRAQILPDGFTLVERGLAAKDGKVRFYEPSNPSHISHSVVHHDRTRGSFIDVEVRRLSTLMAELGHDEIDVLKLDIEGAEYDAIDDLLDGPVRPLQVLVEFHHQLNAFSVQQTRASIDALASAGYALFHVAPNGRECSFVRA